MPRSSERGGSRRRGRRCHPTPRRGAARPRSRPIAPGSPAPEPDHSRAPGPVGMSRSSGRRPRPASVASRAVRARARAFGSNTLSGSSSSASTQFLGRVERPAASAKASAWVLVRFAEHLLVGARLVEQVARGYRRILGSVPRGEHELAVPAHRTANAVVPSRSAGTAATSGTPRSPRPCRRPGRRSRRPAAVGRSDPAGEADVAKHADDGVAASPPRRHQRGAVGLAGDAVGLRRGARRRKRSCSIIPQVWTVSAPEPRGPMCRHPRLGTLREATTPRRIDCASSASMSTAGPSPARP